MPQAKSFNIPPPVESLFRAALQRVLREVGHLVISLLQHWLERQLGQADGQGDDDTGDSGPAGEKAGEEEGEPPSPLPSPPSAADGKDDGRGEQGATGGGRSEGGRRAAEGIRRPSPATALARPLATPTPPAPRPERLTAASLTAEGNSMAAASPEAARSAIGEAHAGQPAAADSLAKARSSAPEASATPAAPEQARATKEPSAPQTATTAESRPPAPGVSRLDDGPQSRLVEAGQARTPPPAIPPPPAVPPLDGTGSPEPSAGVRSGDELLDLAALIDRRLEAAVQRMTTEGDLVDRRELEEFYRRQRRAEMTESLF